MTQNNVFSNFLTEALESTKGETLVSVDFWTDDHLHAAFAEIEVVYVDGKPANGSIFTRTKGGVYYSAKSLREAIQMAKDLVSHWNKSDWDWEPKPNTEAI